MNKIVQLHCVAQNYNWGKYGADSAVAKLLQVSDDDQSTPYAELWMGAHPSGPSKVEIENHKLVPLKEYIEMNGGSEKLLGSKVVERFGQDFPFLFKVLSIRTALSIQSHPDSKLAKQLHSSFPDIYKDPYHKPEIAIALTPFKALCSFRKLSEILEFIDNVKELKDTISSQLDLNQVNKNNCNLYLQSIVTALLQADSTLVANQLLLLTNRLEKERDGNNKLNQLILTLHQQYVGDVGVFFAYLLNYMEMQPGEALYLPAGEPHAYIAGDCIECMAPSDNVVRAGLTPKLKDWKTLAQMLTYTTGCPSYVTPTTHESNGVKSCLFQPPVDEFEVERIQLSPSSSYTSTHQSPSIVLLTDSSVTINKTNYNSSSSSSNPTILRQGTVLFVPCNTELKIENQNQSTDSTLFIARVNKHQYVDSMMIFSKMMNAAVLHKAGVPVYETFPIPQVSNPEEEVIADVLASSIKQLDIGKASGRHYLSYKTFPTTVGVDGIARLDDGRLVYAMGITGMFAEKALLKKDKWVVLDQENTSNVVAAASVPNAILGAGMALNIRGQFKKGNVVFVNGATGFTGKVAVQLAKISGAAYVVASGRNENTLKEMKEKYGIDDYVVLGDNEEAFTQKVKEIHSKHPFDVVIDYLWGRPAELVLDVLAAAPKHTVDNIIRYVTVGEMAGSSVPIKSAYLRSSGLEIVGSGFGSFPPGEIERYLKQHLNSILSLVNQD
ncbi:zinc-containing alcohol dehydrogenase [Cavenderia fasciculata]|uniref:mannose-6-phosphate isomerase n=1 Tax=Cavenderia fasciculata TaxID=261658 RepID=F4PHE2_CACFS|nr:zinc-containing alcohol dehydrogenase [Cavenderia fasciculata]EGG25126.1 zinc-containing alcohol dehydrogenase [Cavenderia fasciculata]|eukprot:XP_004362977.1 zinc-containing alcohol dehydrogenase [Cavenderia fasciculata]